MPYRSNRRNPHALAIGAALALAACGGGGGSETEPPTPTPTRAATIQGTVATGEALANALVRITDRKGAAACTENPLLSNETGAFKCELTADASAPLILVATDPAGLREPLVSMATTLPLAGEDATINITPMTTAIVAQVAPHKDPLALTVDTDALAALDASQLAAVRANVISQLAQVLAALGLDPATFDPISTPFVGGSSEGADSLLDQVRVSYENGSPVLSNVLNPDADSVPMAGMTEAPPVPPTTVTGFSVTELDIVQVILERCFAVPSATRAGSPACDGLVVDDADPAKTGGATYLHNSFGRASFNALIASADMDGARFNRPELLRYFTGEEGRDVATVNVRFTDKNGVGDNRFLVLKKFPGTATDERKSDWWAYGNQRQVNAYVRASIRKQEQFLPPDFVSAWGSSLSRFQTGLEIYMARSAAAGSLENLRYARVKGPGLPTAGLVFADPGGLPQTWMAIHNAKGVIPTDAQTGTSSNNIFYLQRTEGIVGVDAFTLRLNPFVGAAEPGYNNWAHPAMYGETPNPAWQFDLSKVPAWSEYEFELFTAADANPGTPTTPTPALTFKAQLTTPVIPAAYAATQQWHDQPASTRALVTDGAPAAGSLTLEWLINPYAQPVASVNAYSYDSADGGKTVNSASTPVPKGASSQQVLAVGGTFPALTTSRVMSRSLQWRYKMLDGSYKDQTLTFN